MLKYEEWYDLKASNLWVSWTVMGREGKFEDFCREAYNERKQ